MQNVCLTDIIETEDFAGIVFETIFDHFHDGVLVTDAKGKIIYYNDTMGKVDGLVADEVIGLHILDVYKLSENQSNTLRCLKTGMPVINQTMLYTTKSGQVANTISNAFPIYLQGKLTGTLVFTKDYETVTRLMRSAQATSRAKDRAGGARYTFDHIIGQSALLKEVIGMAKMAAGSPSAVMVTGETGTGKEMLAQAIHNHSPAACQHFIPINCAAIPEHLLEGMLFGTARGAFTGAQDKAGLFEKANGGTLFLDEVNSMPLALQSKLLRVLQEKRIRRLGATREIPVAVKIISAVKDDPHTSIENGTLRIDLFYRLAVVMINLPPLADRLDDLEDLTEHFINRNNRRLDKQVQHADKKLLALFSCYHWPGNIRELEHVIEGAMNIIGDDVILQITHLPHHIRRFCGAPPRQGGTPAVRPAGQVKAATRQCPTCESLSQNRASLPARKNHIERQAIVTALKQAKGNVSGAARHLGLASPQTLHYKMKKYNLDRNDFRH